MVEITEKMVRSKAEHNELMITTLEELSLHQQDITRISNIDRWCKNLKILYLQSNLISKIENLARLKQLRYLNLAMNNVEEIENLRSCENLEKLDLTINFVRVISNLKEELGHLEHFKELYLTGNPITKFPNYREYVIASLPHLTRLDGEEVTRSDRINNRINDKE